MTNVVFKSLIVLGAFAFFGGHMPVTGSSAALALPQIACEADLGSCRVGETDVALGDRSPVLAGLAMKARGTPLADLTSALSDPQVIGLLDQRVIPEFAVNYAEGRVAAAATQLIEGIETGGIGRIGIER